MLQINPRVWFILQLSQGWMENFLNTALTYTGMDKLIVTFLKSHLRVSRTYRIPPHFFFPLYFVLSADIECPDFIFQCILLQNCRLIVWRLLIVHCVAIVPMSLTWLHIQTVQIILVCVNSDTILYCNRLLSYFSDL